MDTSILIKQLSREASPVRPLPPPWLRTLVWIGLSAPGLAIVIVIMSPRNDLPARLAEWQFLIELSAALATGVTAAMAAFLSVIPGTGRKALLLPLLPLAIWLGSLGHGCLADWFRLGPDGLTVTPSWRCFTETVMISALPAFVLAVMLRRGAPLTPVTTAALGALGAAGIGNFGLRFFHPQDASIMILVWQLGSVFLLTALAGLCGRYLFNWASVIARSRRFAVG